MARNLVVNGVTYNNVESLEMTDENGEKVLYTEGGTGGGSDDGSLARSIVDRTIESYSDNELTAVGAYAFYGCSSLLSAAIRAATSLGSYAFSGCSALASVVADALKTISQYAFNGCTSLTSFDGSLVTSIGTYAFNGCSALAEVNFPLATSVAAYAFNGTIFTHLSLPSLKSMTANAFRGTDLVSVDFPLVTNIGNNSIRGVPLTSVTFPKVTSTSSEAMRNCTALTYVDLPLITSFGTYTFYNCTALKTLILRNTAKVCSMSNVNMLTSTLIAGGTGYIYVPSALVDSYKAATNWSTFADQFRALEDYTVDGTTTGELDETKI